MQYRRQLDRVSLDAVELFECLRELFVERRDDAVQDLDQVEQNLLTLVRDGEPLARMLFRLPCRGQLDADAAQIVRVS